MSNRWPHLVIAFCITLFALPVPAFSDATIGGKTVDCYCTDKTGSRIELGQIMCLEVDGRRFTAQCQMSLNVPMWRELRSDCVMSDAGKYSPIPPTAHTGLTTGPVGPVGSG